MLHTLLRTCATGALTAALVLGTVATPALADVVVADDQIVQGNQCVGAPCVNAMAFAGIPLWLRIADTPAIRLDQPSGAFDAQIWDIAGNEANFFVRDATGGSTLPFRIRPTAGTSSIDINPNWQVRSEGTFYQRAVPGDRTALPALTPAAALAALRTLPIARYTKGGDADALPRVAPLGADFFSAFGVGGGSGGLENYLAPSDMAGVALLAIQGLDTRVSALALTPGPTGPTGPTGTTGPANTTANERIARLEKTNRKLNRDLRKLQRQVNKLAAAS